MIPTNIQNMKSAFSLFQFPKLLSQQDEQFLLLASQNQSQIEQKQSNQQQQQQQQQQQFNIQPQIIQQFQQATNVNNSVNNNNVNAAAQLNLLPLAQQQQQQQQKISHSNNIQYIQDAQNVVNNQQQQQQQQINIDLELFNQTLFYQAVFAGKELEQHLDSVLKRKNKLENLVDYFVGFSFPNFIKLIGNITLASLQGTMDQNDMTIINELRENPLKIILKENVWKLATQIISKKLFQYEDRIQDNYYKELSQMLIFKQEVADMVFSFFADKSNMITLGSFYHFYQKLQTSNEINENNNQSNLRQQNQSNNYQNNTKNCNEIYGNLSFQQFGGQIFKISRQNFHNSLDGSINLLGAYFEKQNTIVSFIKRSARQKLNIREDQLLQSYLKIMGDFKQTNLKNFLNNLCDDIFGQSESIEKNVFLNKVAAIHVNTNSRIIFTLLEIIRIELDLVHQDEFIQFFQKNVNFNSDLSTGNAIISGQEKNNNSSEASNYYLKTIDKLLNKCVFNGDDKCECKKCQCIRRNRNSAKESQKKKREALQQIGPLLEKQELLEKRLMELESENTILRNLITQMVSKGSNYNNISEIFQPISKIISYQLKEEDEGNNNNDLCDGLEGSKPTKKICTNNSKEGSSQSLDIQNIIQNSSASINNNIQSNSFNSNQISQQ